jgi:tetratricopeptide (TPR) repeat protein
MRRYQSWIERAGGLACLVLLGWAKGAHAGASDGSCARDPICLKHFTQASDSYKAQNYVEALLEFRAAYGRRPEPRILLNIGRSLFKLGQHKEALDYYQRFADMAPNDKASQEKLEHYRAEARAALAPPTSEPSPPPDSPAAGTNAGEGKRDGEPVSEPEPEPSPDIPQAPVPMPAVAAAIPAATGPPTAPTRPTHYPLYKRWWLWTAVGLVVVGTTVGVLATSYSQPAPSNADLQGAPAFRPFN